MSSAKIRNAAIEDATAIAELSSQLGYPTTIQQSYDRLATILESDEHQVLVACSNDGLIAGWAHVFLTLRVESEPFAELGGLIVAQEYRRQGIGRRLLVTSEKWANHRGIAKLRVRSRSTRNTAHDFYEQLGFSRTKEQHVFDKLLTKQIQTSRLDS